MIGQVGSIRTRRHAPFKPLVTIETEIIFNSFHITNQK